MKKAKSTNAAAFKNVLTLLIMGTGGGKSTLIQYIANLINTSDTRYYMFSGSTNNLSNQIPTCTTYVSPDKDALYDVLCKIWDTQNKLACIKKFIYNKVQDVICLLDKAGIRDSSKINRLLRSLDEGERDEMSKINSVSYLCREISCKHSSSLKAVDKTENEQLLANALLYRGYKAVIIIDDLSEIVDELLSNKSTKKIMTAIVTKSRHFDVSMIVAVHVPTASNGVMRLNAGIIMWGNKQEMIASADVKYFEKRTINKYKSMRTPKPKYAKFAFIRTLEDIFVFDFNPKMFDRKAKLGCRYLHTVSERYRKKDCSDDYDSIKTLCKPKL